MGAPPLQQASLYIYVSKNTLSLVRRQHHVLEMSMRIAVRSTSKNRRKMVGRREEGEVVGRMEEGEAVGRKDEEVVGEQEGEGEEMGGCSEGG